MDGYSGCETCFKYFSPLKKYIYIYVFLAPTSGAIMYLPRNLHILGSQPCQGKGTCVIQ